MINVAVVGCGYWGPNLIRNFEKPDKSRVTYACDLDEKKLERIKKLYPDVGITARYDDILRDKDIDAVAIATPVFTHFKLAKMALEAGKHVLIEKPITASSQEARELIKLARDNGLKLMVDHTFEYAGPVIKIKEMIDSGHLGKIFTINASRLNLGLFQPDINVIWDLAPHDISLMIYWLGKKPETVSAMGEDHVQKGIEDDAHVFLRFGNKITGAIHMSWLDPVKVRRTAIVGSDKMIVFDDTQVADKISIYDKGVRKIKSGEPIIEYWNTFEEFQYLYKQGDTTIPKLDLWEPLGTMAEHFIECIEQNKKPKTDGESGLRVVEVIEAAQKSLMQRGREVEVE